MYQTKKWNFLWQTNNKQFNFVDRCPRHRNQRQDDGMSSLELVLQSVQGARRTESTNHREIAQFPITSGSQCNRGIDFGIIEDSIWINNGCNGIYKVEYYTGIVLNLQTQKNYKENLENFRENVTCTIFLTRSYEVSFFFL